jgi:hypothetical protein
MEAVMVRRGSARQALLRTSCFAISFCGLIAVGALSARCRRVVGACGGRFERRR